MHWFSKKEKNKKSARDPISRKYNHNQEQELENWGWRQLAVGTISRIDYFGNAHRTIQKLCLRTITELELLMEFKSAISFGWLADFEKNPYHNSTMILTGLFNSDKRAPIVDLKETFSLSFGFRKLFIFITLPMQLYWQLHIKIN